MIVTVGFSRPKAWFVPFAWAIMGYQRANYSHVYIRLRSDSLDRDLIYQASSTMVNFMGSEYFETQAKIVAEYEVDVEDLKKKELLQYCIDRAGMKYSMTQVLGLVLNRQLGLKIWSNGEKAFVCSELVARIIKDLKVVDGFSNLDYITPKDIRKLCDSNPSFRRKV